MELALIAPTIILFVAMITDIQTHKIYNKWVVISVFIALINNYYFFGFDGIRHGAVAAAVVLLMTLPLVLLGVLGAGDMKLLFAFGLTTTYTDIFTITVFSFIWAAIIGLLLAILRRQGIYVLKNVAQLLSSSPLDEKSLHKIPYSVAIFAAWLTYMFLGYKQGHF